MTTRHSIRHQAVPEWLRRLECTVHEARLVQGAAQAVSDIFKMVAALSGAEVALATNSLSGYALPERYVDNAPASSAQANVALYKDSRIITLVPIHLASAFTDSASPNHHWSAERVHLVKNADWGAGMMSAPVEEAHRLSYCDYSVINDLWHTLAQAEGGGVHAFRQQDHPSKALHPVTFQRVPAAYNRVHPAARFYPGMRLQVHSVFMDANAANAAVDVTDATVIPAVAAMAQRATASLIDYLVVGSTFFVPPAPLGEIVLAPTPTSAVIQAATNTNTPMTEEEVVTPAEANASDPNARSATPDQDGAPLASLFNLSPAVNTVAAEKAEAQTQPAAGGAPPKKGSGGAAGSSKTAAVPYKGHQTAIAHVRALKQKASRSNRKNAAERAKALADRTYPRGNAGFERAAAPF